MEATNNSEVRAKSIIDEVATASRDELLSMVFLLTDLLGQTNLPDLTLSEQERLIEFGAPLLEITLKTARQGIVTTYN